MNTKHDKDCELGDNWKECPACQGASGSLKRVVKPNRTLTMLWCPVCGCDDQTRRLGRKHFSFGKLCEGIPIKITYKLVRYNAKHSAGDRDRCAVMTKG